MGRRYYGIEKRRLLGGAIVYEAYNNSDTSSGGAFWDTKEEAQACLNRWKAVDRESDRKEKDDKDKARV